MINNLLDSVLESEEKLIMKKKLMAVFTAAMAVSIIPAGITSAASAKISYTPIDYTDGVANTIQFNQSVTKEVNETVSTSVPDVVADGEWWSVFSDYYVLNGDFDVTFDITLNDTKIESPENTPALIFCSDANRGRSGYQEYFTLHSYFYENAPMTFDGNFVTYEADWEDWRIWKNAMNGAKMTVNVKRAGDGFTVSYVINGNDNDVYKATVSFLTGADSTIRLFWAASETGFSIDQYTRDKDYWQSILPDGVRRREDKVFEIFPDSECVSGGGVDVEIDLTKIFTQPDVPTMAAVFAEEKEVPVTVNGNKQFYKVKVLNENPCRSCKVIDGNGADVFVDDAFYFKVKVTGSDAEVPVTDTITYSAITSDYTVEHKECGDGEYLFQVIPKTAAEGAVEVKCGTRTAYCTYTARERIAEVPTPPAIDVTTPPAIDVTTPPAVEVPTQINKCVEMSCTQGSSVTTLANTVFVLTVKAVPESLTRPFEDEIVLSKGNLVQKLSSEYVNGVKYTSFAIVAPEGNSSIEFTCGEKTLTIKLTALKRNVYTVTTPSVTNPTTPPTEDEKEEDESTTTPPADSKEEEDEPITTPPTDSKEEEDESTTTPPADSKEEDKNDTVTEVKKVKVSSIKAKRVKGCVKVYGKVTKNATVKVVAKGKTLKTKALKNGKFHVKFSKKVSAKIKGGVKIKVRVSKAGYKTVKLNFKVG